MKHLGIDVSVQHLPELDPNYIPLFPFYQSFLKDAKKPLDIAVERSGGQVAVYKTFIHGTPEMAQADLYYVDRIIKTLLWLKGGFKVYLAGDRAIFEAIHNAYSKGGTRISWPASMKSPSRWSAATPSPPRSASPRP